MSPMSSSSCYSSYADHYLSAQTRTDMELMKERFAKLLLGENMSGDGKGVSSALALSNAITNLAGGYTFESNRQSEKRNEI